MKPLTIEQLKTLQVDDWVWIVRLTVNIGRYKQIESQMLGGIYFNVFYDFDTYGIDWVAYKNKEQAEAKSEIVELPCKIGDNVYIVDNDRHWAEIDTIRIYNEHNGSQKIVYEWAQYDKSLELTEVWDDGEFDIDDIGKTVFVEGIHDDKIKEFIDKENKKFIEWASEAER